MEKTKTKARSEKKRAPKAKSRYYVVKSVQQARDDLSAKLEAYTAKYVQEPLSGGKELIQDMKADPRKTVTRLFDEGKEKLGNLGKETRSKLSDVVDEARRLIEKTGKEPRQMLNELYNDGRKWIVDQRKDARQRMKALGKDYRSVRQGIEKDARSVAEEILEGSRRALDRNPVKKRVAKEIQSRMKAIPAQLNLPSRKDVDHLATSVKELSAKIDTLSRQWAA
jgi:polyhydroxyalkanoate synthesis regulator phasin